MLWCVETGSGVDVCIDGWSNLRLEKEQVEIHRVNWSMQTSCFVIKKKCITAKQTLSKRVLRGLIRCKKLDFFIRSLFEKEKWVVFVRFLLTNEPDRLSSSSSLLTIKFIDELNFSFTRLVIVDQRRKFVALKKREKLQFADSTEKETDFKRTPAINVDSLTNVMHRNGR